LRQIDAVSFIGAMVAMDHSDDPVCVRIGCWEGKIVFNKDMKM